MGQSKNSQHICWWFSDFSQWIVYSHYWVHNWLPYWTLSHFLVMSNLKIQVRDLHSRGTQRNRVRRGTTLDGRVRDWKIHPAQVSNSSLMSFYWVISCEQCSPVLLVNQKHKLWPVQSDSPMNHLPFWINLSNHLLNWINQGCVFQKHHKPKNRSLLLALSEEYDV